jgi:hydrogenase nickel incorporation protein HypA/HybF
MHELSIAVNIVDIACEEAQRQGDSRVDAVYLNLGVLSGVVKEALLFSWELACEGSRIAGARLAIRDVPGREMQVTAIEVLAEGDPETVHDTASG